MPRKVIPLTDVTIRNAKSGTKSVRFFDGAGLYLEVSPTGGKLWRMKYRFSGKEKLLSFGTYPAVSLRDARERREEAHKMLEQGKDPGEVKKAAKAAIEAANINSFEAVAREWFSRWKTDKPTSHSSKVIAHLENDAFPWIGSKLASDVNPATVLSVLHRIADRGALDTAHRVKGIISMAMRHAIITGRAEFDPCASLRGALPSAKVKHFAAIREPLKLAELLRAIDTYKGGYVTRAALKLAPLVFVRIGELRAARWADIDLEKGEWSFVASKTSSDHIVPLARQAVEILRDLHPLTGGDDLVFPGQKPGQPFSDATINKALRSLGYDTKNVITGHGFRSTACTMLAEQLRMPIDWIERQLAHRVPGALGNAYNRTQFIDDRRRMMQQWADYLDQLKRGADVIPLRPAG
jgi:integrase